MSFDVYYMGVAHVHGGQTKVIGFHDHFSGLNWVKLLKAEDTENIALATREYHAYCLSHKVTIRHVHTDNAKPHVGPLMNKIMREEIKCKYTTIAPNNPRSNGAMERQWGTMGKETRSLLEKSKLPRNFAFYALAQTAWPCATRCQFEATSPSARCLCSPARSPTRPTSESGDAWPTPRSTTARARCPTRP